MKHKIVHFLKKAFPFIAVIILWRLSGRFWNPGGVLAMIPIFYCSFVKNTPGFTLFAVLFCFLIDYNFDTKLFWTSFYCLFYSINGFQNYLDLSISESNAFQPFLIFMGVALIIVSLLHLNWTVLFRMLWIFAWSGLLYIPITQTIKRISYD